MSLCLPSRCCVIDPRWRNPRRAAPPADRHRRTVRLGGRWELRRQMLGCPAGVSGRLSGGETMAVVAFRGVTKVYPGGARAVSGMDLEVGDGEFVVLVGPSGCGKTTALRMVAGLEKITSGTIRIGGKGGEPVASRDRDIAMVFQNYALYPHLTVYDNIAFGLRLRKVPQGRDRRAGTPRGAGPRSRGVPRAQASRPLRWPASAGRHGARDRARAAGVPHGRAAVQPGRQAARADARRDQQPAARARRHHDLRHARSDRSHDHGRQGRRDAQGRAAAGRRPAGALRPTRQPVRRRLHRQPDHEHGRSAAGPGRRRAGRGHRRPASRRWRRRRCALTRRCAGTWASGSCSASAPRT